MTSEIYSRAQMDSLTQAAGLADAGTEMPDFESRGPKGRLVRRLAKRARNRFRKADAARGTEVRENFGRNTPVSSRTNKQYRKAEKAASDARTVNMTRGRKKAYTTSELEGYITGRNKGSLRKGKRK